MSEKELKHVIITVDGACLGNGQENTRAAAAAILEYNGRRRAIAHYIGQSTNQRAEIIAAAFALEALKEPCIVTLRSDSQYVIQTMTGAFKRKSNQELWQRLDAVATPHQVTYEWIRGHNGHPEQEAADKIARATAKTGLVDSAVLSEVVSRLENTYTDALKNAVTRGLRYLAQQCDGAFRQDGKGFNRFDAERGHALAAIQNLTPLDVARGRRLLHRYQKQLSAFDPSLVAIL
jgi:ribonuclease HI